MFTPCSSVSFTGTSEVSWKATNQFTYSTGQCDDVFVGEFVNEFKTLIGRLHTIHGICGQSCDFANIRVQHTCGGDARRKRRNANNHVSISFDSIIGSERQQVCSKRYLYDFYILFKHVTFLYLSNKNVL